MIFQHLVSQMRRKAACKAQSRSSSLARNYALGGEGKDLRRHTEGIVQWDYHDLSRIIGVESSPRD